MFDLIWKKKLVKHRGAAYAWMRKTLGVKSKSRISDLTPDQCRALIQKVYETFPLTRGKHYFLTDDPLKP